MRGRGFTRASLIHVEMSIGHFVRISYTRSLGSTVPILPHDEKTSLCCTSLPSVDSQIFVLPCVWCSQSLTRSCVAVSCWAEKFPTSYSQHFNIYGLLYCLRTLERCTCFVFNWNLWALLAPKTRVKLSFSFEMREWLLLSYGDIRYIFSLT